MKKMNKETLIETENEIKKLFLEKKIHSMFHLSGGNEEELIRIFENIGEEDFVFSNHRSHYHALLKGMKHYKLIQKILNNKSMHLYDKSLNFFSSSIVGGCLPIALGVAIAIKRKEAKNHVWVFVGDMASRMGIFHECLKYAEGFDLPITFVIEDNKYGISMNTKETWGKENKQNKTIHYEYDMTYPHCGTGVFVNFDDI